MSGILFFIFASCEPLNIEYLAIWHACLAFKHVLIQSTKWWQEGCLIAEHTFYSVNLVNDFSQGEGTQYKRPYGDMPPTWVAK